MCTIFAILDSILNMPLPVVNKFDLHILVQKLTLIKSNIMAFDYSKDYFLTHKIVKWRYERSFCQDNKDPLSAKIGTKWGKIIIIQRRCYYIFPARIIYFEVDDFVTVSGQNITVNLYKIFVLSFIIIIIIIIIIITFIQYMKQVKKLQVTQKWTF